MVPEAPLEKLEPMGLSCVVTSHHVHVQYVSVSLVTTVR